MLFLCFLAIMYFLPTVIASNRGLGVTPILLLNLFFGWTGVGWIALILGVVLAPSPYRVYPVAPGYPYGRYW